MKRYICGLCRKGKASEEFVSNREGLRKHLKEEHFIVSKIANASIDRHASDKTKKAYWITEDF